MFLHKAIVQYVNPYLPPTNPWSTLLASVPIALASGTVFVYSAYSTQLAERCQLDASMTANLGIMISIGGATGGVFSGLLTDTYGTQVPILFSTVTLSLGYFMLYANYKLGPDSSFLGLILAMLCVGVGAVAGYFASLKAVAMNFENHKGTAQSITIASLAIAGLLYLYISSFLTTEAFLKFLSISCGLLTFIAFIFIREGAHEGDEHEVETPSIVESSLSSSLSDTDGYESSVSELTALIGVGKLALAHSLKHLNLSDSLKHPAFWFHYFIFAITQGFGQMYIYSVGFILKAIYIYYSSEESESESILSVGSLQQLQAFHVSLIALSSFIGRLSSGPASDYFVKVLKIQRHWILIFGNLIMLTGHALQLVSIQATFETLEDANVFLLVLSCLIGFAYGFTFTGYPVIVSDLFSMKYNSFIWGCLYTSTTFGMALMSKFFGIIYDKNSTTWDNKHKVYVCTKGSGCYHLTFEVTTILCLFIILVISGYIRFRKQKYSSS